MADTRELILSRMFTVLGSVTPTINGAPGAFETIARNQGELEEFDRPALVLFDGDETVGEQFLRRGPRTAQLVTMSPQVAVVIGGREPQNTLLGQDLNANRIAVIDALVNDSTLEGLVGTNGSISYGGLVTDLGWNLPLEGTHVYSFLITYPFFPSKLP